MGTLSVVAMPIGNLEDITLKVHEVTPYGPSIMTMGADDIYTLADKLVS